MFFFSFFLIFLVFLFNKASDLVTNCTLLSPNLVASSDRGHSTNGGRLGPARFSSMGHSVSQTLPV